MRNIDEVLATHGDALLTLPGVVGAAIGICEVGPCIRVFLEKANVATRRRIPQSLDGYPVRAEVTGRIHRRERE